MNIVTKPLFQDGILAPKSAEIAESGDAAATTATTAVMALDDIFTGNLTSGDADWVQIDLVAGTSYVFSLWGTGGSAAGLKDSILTLHDSAGTQVAVNDDHVPGQNGNRFSLIEFDATVTGTYYLNVAGYAGEAGNYTLSATDNVLTPTQVASYLTEVNWSRPTQLAFDVAPGGTISYNIANLTAEGQQLATWALEAWTAVTGLNFNLTLSTSANLQFDDASAGAFAGPSSFNPLTGAITYSEINVGTAWLTSYGTSIDSYSFLTYMHEIGHALGVGHAGGYDGAATYGDDNHYLNDSYQMSIMSYFSQTENTTINDPYALPITPMMADIIAIQSLYGLGTTGTDGDTVWGENNTVGGYLGDIFGNIFDGNALPASTFGAGSNYAYTIFDSGGIDTFNFVSDTAGMVIDLTPGSFEGIDGDNGNFLIAEGTIIENVTTGSGNDSITGNTAANQINSGGGDDTIMGMGGDDILTGGAGADTLNGGADTDTASYADSNFAVNVSLASGFTAGGHAAGDVLTDIEDLQGSAYNDVLRGDGGNNTLEGMAGGDTLQGNGGTDTVDYSASDAGVNISLLTGFATGGHATGDTITSVENLTGSNFSDLLSGDNGANVLNGGGGDDLLRGRGGADTLNGGEGSDVASYSDSNFGVNISLLTGFTAGGHAAGDTLIDIANLQGSAHSDILRGDGTDNYLEGMGGGDTIQGNGGSDTAVYLNSNAGVNISLLTGYATGGHATGDTITGVENLIGSTHNDLLSGDNGANILEGLDGNDLLRGRGGADQLFGDAGSDTASYSDSNFGVNINFASGFSAGGHAAGDTFFSIENLQGSGYVDVLRGDGGDNIIEGMAGGDTLQGNGGVDTLSYAGSNFGVNVSLASGFAAGGHASGDTHSGFESLTGSSHADILRGDGGNNTLTGNAGADQLFGYGGADMIIAGAGDDTITSGSGADTFLFEDNGGQDLITDFELGVDNVQLFGTMYGAATNGAEIVSLFGQIVGGKAALVFDVDTSMVFDSLTSLTGLEDSIMIVA